MSIFISFSGTAREEYALKFLDFFNAFGIHCWYDQHELFLGDLLKETIISKGIESVQYCILIINKTYLERNWPCIEAKMLYDRLDKEVIFPILLDISKEDLKKSKLSFLLNIKYQFLKENESIYPIALQILNRIFHDIVMKLKFNSMNTLTKYFKRLTLSNSIDIYNALQTYNNFSETNYRDRTIFLICLIRLFNNNLFEKTIREVSYHLYNNEKISFDMYKIIESIFLISISNYLE